MKKFFLPAAWAITILVLTLIPGKAIPDVPIFGIDKVVHFALFGMQIFLTLFALKPVIFAIKDKPILISILGCIAFGIMIEVIQNFVPGRSCSIYDVIANTIGVFLGYWIYRLIFKKA